MPKKFWKFKNQTSESAELMLYGDISDTSWYGDEVTPQQFSEELKGLGDVQDITVRINSGGGDVFAAQAIGNLLEQHVANVTAKIDGLCASAATIIACHCNKVVAAQDSTYMIHPVRIGLCGYMDAVKLQQYIDALAVIRDNIIRLYAKKTGRDEEEVAEQMDATSWWTGSEAMENGFVDELIEEPEKTETENRNGLLFVNGVGTHLRYDDVPKFVRDGLAEAPAKPIANKKPPKKAAVDKTPKGGRTMEIKNVEDLRKEYPDMVEQIEAAAAQQAAADERQRIQDIDEMVMAGSEELANEAKFTKPVTAAEFAMQQVKNAKKAEETKKDTHLANTENDVDRSGMRNVQQENGSPENHQGDEFLDAIRSVNGKTK
jgi:ATP-dependent protease ClpP protease subunit